jgi:hypothetical protein
LSAGFWFAGVFADAPKRPNQLIKQCQGGGQTTLMTTGFAPDRETVYLPAP